MVCRDESNNPVDWYVVYKLPKVAQAVHPLVTGLGYAYLSSKSQSGWTLSDLDISSEKSIFGNTLHSLYTAKMDPGISFINYTDGPPTGANESITAHANGVIATDDTLGYWLIHSIPKFAAQESGHKYVYPESGEINGQTALCITLNITEMDKVLTQMLYMQPDIYAMNISTGLKSKSKTIGALSAREWSSGDKHVETIVSAGGVRFTSISKTPDHHIELYAEIVAPVLNVSLLAETWGQGVDTQLPTLGALTLNNTVENVQNISASYKHSNVMGRSRYPSKTGTGNKSGPPSWRP
ncbi:unnamed protein product [Oppiella nova]|uniref:Plancitoxin-1 n=1 Tax=Oppiella nova TaxID=334625 RepID=A0A7R9LPH4_9ACAR|nr:unnamed protein product [Oppiella nova]CAG2165644.1 unnamed protein product [Oppiella nova]